MKRSGRGLIRSSILLRHLFGGTKKSREAQAG